jgi:hypothetical protein
LFHTCSKIEHQNSMHYSIKWCSPVASTSILSPTVRIPSSSGVTCIPKHAALLPLSMILYFRMVVPGSFRSAMPVNGSTLGSLQRVVRQEMSRLSEPKRAWAELVRIDKELLCFS